MLDEVSKDFGSSLKFTKARDLLELDTRWQVGQIAYLNLIATASSVGTHSCCSSLILCTNHSLIG